MTSTISKNFFVFSMYISLISLFLISLMSGFSVCFELKLFNLGSLMLYFDWISWVFFLMVGFVSVMVFIYSESYMVGDIFKKKFNWILFMFVMSMFLMISSSSLFWIMVGWDGLGLSSFCLIFFYNNWKSFNSSIVTFLTNRFGDVCMMICIYWSFCNLSVISYTSCVFSFFVSILLIFGSFTKSAQIPFSSWLPLAMAAPTPVSSLVHSSTLVTAGVYLLIRFYDLINLFVMNIVFFVSMITVIMAAMSSLGEIDFKKIIALSTLSHIGLIFMFISLGEVNSALMHMFMHALFKSLLFMVSGSIIHSSMNNQDIRLVGISSLSFGESVPFLVSLFSMFGSPFLSGFFSKEIFLMNMISDGNLNSFMLILWFMFAVAITSSYSFRMMKNSVIIYSTMNKTEKEMNFSFLPSSLFSVFAGGFLNDLIVEKFLYDYSLFNQEGKYMLYLSLILGLTFGLNSFMLKGFSSLYGMWGMSNFIFMFERPISLISGSLFWKIDLKGMSESLIYLGSFQMSLFGGYFKLFSDSFVLIKFFVLFVLSFFFFSLFYSP